MCYIPPQLLLRFLAHHVLFLEHLQYFSSIISVFRSPAYRPRFALCLNLRVRKAVAVALVRSVFLQGPLITRFQFFACAFFSNK